MRHLKKIRETNAGMIKEQDLRLPTGMPPGLTPLAPKEGSTSPVKVDLLGLFTLVTVVASKALDSALSSLMIKNS